MTNKMRQFIRGMGSAIDLGSSSIREERRVGTGVDLNRTNEQALNGDWQKLTQDLGSAVNKTVGKGNGNVKSE